ncbi:hypothetical protein GPECTOR_1g711 [Gonium pectorale]|uniref:Uncharacterized protein n=1 Tax=Gonium pectorale TaxID=33097 RepID=A0A150H589_GONPE|nr:hypothetical protein GPECTOR_1g711 [Gonium pectorale]|eukprot:KXZ56790.1 hypothetical protein GPECTOR_1g711 [Gonium pectorale]
MLSRIAAASVKDLEPVRVERLGASGGPAAPGGVATDGTEAYELARRLVSSAGAGASTAAGADDAAEGGGGGRYTSSARKVRVCVKIPDRTPEDMPAGWDGGASGSGLHFDGQRDSAVVLFTYMRRGCIQLVFDVLGYRQMTASVLPGAAQTAARCAPPTAYGVAAQSDAPPKLEGSLGIHGTLDPQAAAGLQGALALPMLTREHLLRMVGGDGLLAGRTLTVQVGSDVGLVHMACSSSTGSSSRSGSGSGADGPGRDQRGGRAEGALPPATPPDVRVWPQIVCTAGGWGHDGLPAQPRKVLVSCAWVDDATAGPGRADAPRLDGPASDLQLTARQQGQFLPIAAIPSCAHHGWVRAGIRHARDALRPDVVAADVSGQAGPSAAATEKSFPKGSAKGGAGYAVECQVAFAPQRHQGLVQLELCRGGAHSATSGCVLLVPSVAAAFELEQMLAHAAGPTSDPRSSLSALQVLRDLGTFLDITSSVAAAAAEDALAAGAPTRSSAAAAPCVSWALPSLSSSASTAPKATYAVILRRTTAADGECAVSDGDGADGDAEEWAVQQRREHSCAVASLGSRLAFNLLQHLLASGLHSSALLVLDELQQRLGMPAALVGAHVCPGGMTLLHHAARSGSFATLAALAGWLQARGVAPNWAAPTADGLTPLHLLAVGPAGGAVWTLAQLRWPEVRAAWRQVALPPHGCGAAPAEFAAMACGAVAVGRWQRAADVAIGLGVSAAWGRAASLCHAWVPPATLRYWRDLVRPSLAFQRPDLEAAFGAWLARRAWTTDHLFLGLYTAYCALHAVKEGWAFFSGHAAGLILLACRLVLLLGPPAWDAVCAAQAQRRQPGTPSRRTQLAGGVEMRVVPYAQASLVSLVDNRRRFLRQYASCKPV